MCKLFLFLLVNGVPIRIRCHPSGLLELGIENGLGVEAALIAMLEVENEPAILNLQLVDNFYS